MTLSPKQKQTAIKQSRLAQSGNTKAKQFLAAIQENNPGLWKDYESVISGESESGGVKRTDIPEVDSSILSAKQFGVAVNMATRFHDGDDVASRFMAVQDTEAAKGNAVAKVFVAIKNAIGKRTPEQRRAANASVKVVKPAGVTPQTQATLQGQERPVTPSGAPAGQSQNPAQ